MANCAGTSNMIVAQFYNIDEELKQENIQKNAMIVHRYQHSLQLSNILEKSLVESIKLIAPGSLSSSSKDSEVNFENYPIQKSMYSPPRQRSNSFSILDQELKSKVNLNDDSSSNQSGNESNSQEQLKKILKSIKEQRKQQKLTIIQEQS